MPKTTKTKKKVSRKHLIGWYGHMFTCWCTDRRRKESR